MSLFDTRIDAVAAAAAQRFENPLALADGAYPAALASWLNDDGAAAAIRAIRGWAGYHPTPTHLLPSLAARLGVGSVHYKDEAGRFGLGSFKALGGAYAVRRIAAARQAAGLTVCCATDGNHGRSVAWGAQQVGCRCVIYLHAGVSAAREAAIAAFGAEIRRVSGNYDDSVRAAEQDARAHGWHVVSDTSYETYLDVPCDVMHGYMLLVDEVLAGGIRPTHVFVQAGVGGLAAALCARFWQLLGSARPRFVVVEPDEADCVFRSLQAGRPVVVDGALATAMAGLACGEVSSVAWDVLRAGAQHAMRIGDAPALDVMRLLAMPACGSIVAGESATAGLAALIIAARDAAARRELGLDESSSILCIGTEGATDPAIYRAVVGAPEPTRT